jgi:hypothetical protein
MTQDTRSKLLEVLVINRSPKDLNGRFGLAMRFWC